MAAGAKKTATPAPKRAAIQPARPKATRSKLEAEADRAVDRAGRGVRMGELSAAPPARDLGGSGTPLPASMRDRLERIFGADLAAVRVHAGPDAESVTHGKRAVATGTNIYLGATEHLGAPATFPVLVHEVAHVLQQASRPGADGRLVATPSVGTAEPFAWTAPFPATPVTGALTDPSAIWLKIANGRGATADADRIQKLHDELVAAVDPKAFWAARAANVLAGSADPVLAVAAGPAPKLADLEPLARAALFDSLKVAGHKKAAVKILVEFDRTEALVLDPKVYEDFVATIGVDKLLDRILEIWRDEPILEEARPNKALALSALYLIGVFSGIPDLPIHDDKVASNRKFLNLKDLLSVLSDAGGTPGELVVATFFTIVQLEEYRKSQLKPPKTGVRRVLTEDPKLDERVTIADHLIAEARFVAEHADTIRAGTEAKYGGNDEARHLVVRNYAPALGALGAWAIDFFRLRLLAENPDAEAASRGLDKKTLLGIGSASPEPFPGLKAMLTKHKTDFYARTKTDALPNAQQYDARVQTASAALASQILDIQRKAGESAAPAWNANKGLLAFDASLIPKDRTELIAQGAWLIVALSLYRTGLKKYTAKADDEFRKIWEKQMSKEDFKQWPGDDLRATHRARAAAALYDIATRIGLDTLASEVRPILTAEEALPSGGHQEDDILLITEPWKGFPKGPIEKLSEDMAGKRIAGAEQFTIEQLVLFFQADRYRRLSARIDTLLGGKEGSTFELDHDPLINQAIAAENASQLQPVRYTVAKGGFLYLQRDPSAPGASGVARTPLRTLIEFHPITRAVIRNDKFPTYVVPARQGKPDLVIWKLPEFNGLASYLRQIPAVNELLAKFALVDPRPGRPAPTADELAKMGDDEWWSWWVELTEEGTSALEHQRTRTLQTIPELNKKLAEYAAIDVEPPAVAPTASELDVMPEDEWETWFLKVAFRASDDVWKTRNLGLRNIPDLDLMIAQYDAADRGGGAVNATAVAKLNNAAWLELWKRVIDVGRSRREAMRKTLIAEHLAATLRKDRKRSWVDFLDHERAAFVHERVRIVRTLVVPLLDAYDATTQITDIVAVGKQSTPKRRAAALALQNLGDYFLSRVWNSDWIVKSGDPFTAKDVVPTEHECHQAAALLSIAFKARDKIVEQSGSDWVMRGWDRDVAWQWMPLLEQTLKFLKTAPDLDPWLRKDEQPASSWVGPRREALQNIYDGLWATMAAHRDEFGFVGLQGDGTFENPGSVHEIDNSARTYAPGHPFVIDGVTWEILGVPEGFTYYPALIRSDGVQVLPPKLKIGNTELQNPLDGQHTLLRVMRDGQYLELKNLPDHDPTIRELAYAVMMRSTVDQLVELGEAMETGTMFLVGLALDIAELFPVAGQAAAAARVVLGVGSVLADAQFQELVRAFIEDPKSVLERAWTKLTSMMTLDNVIEAVLLSPGLEFLEDMASLSPPSRKTGATSSTVGKVLRRLANLARAIAGAIGRVIGFAHDVRDDIQAFVLEHPLLARVLAFVAEHIYFIADLVTLMSDWEHLEDNVMSLVADQFLGIVAAIGRLRLPSKLITMPDIVNFFLDIVGKRLGGKYALGYKVVKLLLEAVHRWDEVVGMISKAIIAFLHFDPTDALKFLATFVNEAIDPYITGAQKWVWGVLNTIYQAIPWSKGPLKPIPALKIEDTGEQMLDAHEAQPLMRPGATAGPMPEDVDLGGGRALAPVQRGRFEHQLGADLSHVRVHSGGDAARATQAVGARALTTGSHVLIGPDVALGTTGGDRVLRHELVHVLQQTGPRPPGSPETPELGTPGAGVRIDPAAEKMAEEIAVDGMPSKISARPVYGFQPSMFGMGQRFVDYLTHVEQAKPEIKKIESTHGSTGRKLIGKEVKEDVAGVGAAMTTWINSFSSASMDSGAKKTFGSVDDKIKKYLQEQASNIAEAIDDLAIDSSHAAKVHDDSNETPEMKLGVETFQLKLVRFIVVATGCDIKVELRRMPDGKLDRANPLKSATFEGMNLAIVDYKGAGVDLWDTMMASSFGTTGDANLRAVARIILFALGFAGNPWDSLGGFKLDIARINQIRNEAKDTAGLTLPPAATFWHGENRPADTKLPVLWIGRHGDNTHHDKPDRQSHHTTQYLLVQYFSQQHRLKPFPQMTGEVATTFNQQFGFKFTGSTVASVGNIEVGTLDMKGRRGGGMPAILISAVAHRRGHLHVDPLTSEEAEADERPTQGDRINRWWRDAMSNQLGTKLAGDYRTAMETLDATPKPTTTGATLPTPDMQPLDWIVVNAPKLKAAIPAAMTDVYKSMKDVMIPAILPTLKTLERTWYEQLAIAQGKSIDSGPYHVRDDMVKTVADLAADKNRDIMEAKSHWV